MKYSESIINVFVISVVSLVLIIIGEMLFSFLHIPSWLIVIPYVLVLLYSIFKSKNWNIVFGLLLTAAFMFGIFLLISNSFSQII